jgi:hypothetical protein
MQQPSRLAKLGELVLEGYIPTDILRHPILDFGAKHLWGILKFRATPDDHVYFPELNLPQAQTLTHYLGVDQAMLDRWFELLAAFGFLEACVDSAGRRTPCCQLIDPAGRRKPGWEQPSAIEQRWNRLQPTTTRSFS